MKGDHVVNVRSRKRSKASRLIRMHSNKTEDISSAYAGDICAVFGIECASGDTFVTSPKQHILMESIFVPSPVVSMALKMSERDHSGGLSKALNRFTREDPTLQCVWD